MKTAGEMCLRECTVHGLTEHGARAPRKGAKKDTVSWRCKKCAVVQVTNRRKKVKALLVQEAGNSCKLCGYDKCVAALEFHHVSDETKDFGLSQSGFTFGIDRMRKEMNKCVLLCCRCHREVHAGSAVIAV